MMQHTKKLYIVSPKEYEQIGGGNLSYVKPKSKDDEPGSLRRLYSDMINDNVLKTHKEQQKHLQYQKKMIPLFKQAMPGLGKGGTSSGETIFEIVDKFPEKLRDRALRLLYFLMRIRGVSIEPDHIYINGNPLPESTKNIVSDLLTPQSIVTEGCADILKLLHVNGIPKGILDQTLHTDLLRSVYRGEARDSAEDRAEAEHEHEHGQEHEPGPEIRSDQEEDDAGFDPMDSKISTKSRLNLKRRIRQREQYGNDNSRDEELLGAVGGEPEAGGSHDFGDLTSHTPPQTPVKERVPTKTPQNSALREALLAKKKELVAARSRSVSRDRLVEQGQSPKISNLLNQSRSQNESPKPSPVAGRTRNAGKRSTNPGKQSTKPAKKGRKSAEKSVAAAAAAADEPGDADEAAIPGWEAYN